MADYSSYKPTVNSSDHPAKINSFVDAAEAIATEVENARGGEANLDTRLDGIESDAHYWRLFAAAIL